MACCDLCGIDDSDNLLKNTTKKNKNVKTVLKEFEWITRRKQTLKRRMILDIVCRNCFTRMSQVVKTVREFWRLYNRTRSAAPFRALSENIIINIENNVQMHDETFDIIENSDVRNQIERSVKAEGCTEVEWLLEIDVAAKDIIQEQVCDGNENKFKISQSTTQSENNLCLGKQNEKKPRFQHSAALRKFSHEFMVKNKDSNKWTCTVCNKVLNSVTGKVNHIRIKHLDERPFVCDFCKKMFTTKAFLNHHVRFVHSGKDYLCQICGQKFNNISSFQTHEVTHLGGPQHKCSVNKCSKAFYTKRYLRNHVNGCHSGKKHVCEKCGRTFSTAERMKIHARRHFEKTVTCSFCPQLFYTKSDLGPHMKHHKTWPWKCSKCNLSFKSTRGLQQHSLAAHGERLTRLQLYKKASLSSKTSTD